MKINLKTKSLFFRNDKMELNQNIKSMSEVISDKTNVIETVYGESEALTIMATVPCDEVRFVKQVKLQFDELDDVKIATLDLRKSCDLIYGFEYPYHVQKITLKVEMLTSSGEKSFEHVLGISPIKSINGLNKYVFQEPLPIAALSNCRVSLRLTLAKKDKIPYPIRILGSFGEVNGIRADIMAPKLYWQPSTDVKLIVEDGLIKHDDFVVASPAVYNGPDLKIYINHSLASALSIQEEGFEQEIVGQNGLFLTILRAKS